MALLVFILSWRCFLNHSCWWWYSNWRLGTIPRRRYISISISVPHQLTRTSPQTCGRAPGSSSCSGSQVPEIVFVFESRSSNSLQGQCTTWIIGTIRYNPQLLMDCMQSVVPEVADVVRCPAEEEAQHQSACDLHCSDLGSPDPWAVSPQPAAAPPADMWAMSDDVWQCCYWIGRWR